MVSTLLTENDFLRKKLAKVTAERDTAEKREYDLLSRLHTLEAEMKLLEEANRASE